MLTFALAGCFSPSGSVGLASTTEPASGTAPDETTHSAATTRSDDPGGTASTAGDASGATTQTSLITTLTTTTTGLTEDTSADPTASSTTDDAVCGDGVVQAGEACDDGAKNGPARPCTGQCEQAVCGDGDVCTTCQPAELCDDGNLDPDDGCGPDCTPTGCGDKVVDTGEECDDGNNMPNDGCSPMCLYEHLYVFVTSTKVTGSFNGLAAADLLCSGLAAPVFNPKRKFVAWLSAGDKSAGQRIGNSKRAYVTPKLQMIAMGTDNLLDGALDGPIDEDESGTVVDGLGACDGLASVWTGSAANGSATGDDCGGWTDVAGQGRTGNLVLKDGGWTDACSLSCALPLRIYCIEKAP